MSSIDDLEKLQALREKGALSEEEFQTQKSMLLNRSSQAAPAAAAVPAKRTGLWWKLPLFGVAVLVGLVGLASLSGNGGSTTLAAPSSGGPGTSTTSALDSFPKCNDSVTRQTLTQAFAEAQFAQLLKVKLVELLSVEDDPSRTTPQRRACYAVGSMNNAQNVYISYFLEPRPNERFMLTLEASEEPIPPAASASSVAQTTPMVNQQRTNPAAPAQPQQGGAELITVEGAKVITTPYGTLKIDDEGRSVSVNDKKLDRPEGNPLSAQRMVDLEGRSLVLLQENGGTACPALFVVVELSKSGPKWTETFGSCSDLATITLEGQALKLVMPSVTEQRETYIYSDGSVKKV